MKNLLKYFFYFWRCRWHRWLTFTFSMSPRVFVKIRNGPHITYIQGLGNLKSRVRLLLTVRILRFTPRRHDSDVSDASSGATTSMDSRSPDIFLLFQWNAFTVMYVVMHWRQNRCQASASIIHAKSILNFVSNVRVSTLFSYIKTEKNTALLHINHEEHDQHALNTIFAVIKSKVNAKLILSCSL